MSKDITGSVYIVDHQSKNIMLRITSNVIIVFVVIIQTVLIKSPLEITMNIKKLHGTALTVIIMMRQEVVKTVVNINEMICLLKHCLN